MKLPIFYCSFMKRYLDLSSLLEVSDAKFFDHMGHGGWFVGFTYRMVGQIDEQRFFRELTKPFGDEEYNPNYHEMWWAGEMGGHHCTKVGEQLLCVLRMQREMQELLEAWSKWKEIEPQVYALMKG